MAESGVRVIAYENTRELPVEVLTFRDRDTREPGPTLTIQPGETCRIQLPIAGVRLVPQH